MSSKEKNKKQSLGEKYNLGTPRKREKLSEEEKLYLKTLAEKCRHIIKMGKLWMKTCRQRFGKNKSTD